MMFLSKTLIVKFLKTQPCTALTILIVAILLIRLPVSADVGSDAEKPVNMNYGYEVFTRESIVEIEGKKFRKIEYKKDILYLQLIENKNAVEELRLMCDKEGSPRFNALMPRQIEASVKVIKRTSLFIDGLKQACVEEQNGNKKIEITPEIRIGFLLDDSDPKALIKNKRVYIQPGLMGLGFSGEW